MVNEQLNYFVLSIAFIFLDNFHISLFLLSILEITDLISLMHWFVPVLFFKWHQYVVLYYA